MTTMPTLIQYQRAAERAARKLAVTTRIVVRWQAPPCIIRSKSVGAHIHTREGGKFPRGTICIRHGRSKPMEWMGHEVAHLVSKRHKSKGFLAAMAKVLPKSDVAKMARRIGAIPHRHHWQVRGHWATGSGTEGFNVEWACLACDSIRAVASWRD